MTCDFVLVLHPSISLTFCSNLFLILYTSRWWELRESAIAEYKNYDDYTHDMLNVWAYNFETIKQNSGRSILT